MENNQFTLEEAFLLINKIVLERDRVHIGGKEVASLGTVVGLLTMNDEIELVVKFSTRLSQLTKEEFSQQIEAVTDEHA